MCGDSKNLSCRNRVDESMQIETVSVKGKIVLENIKQVLRKRAVIDNADFTTIEDASRLDGTSNA